MRATSTIEKLSTGPIPKAYRSSTSQQFPGTRGDLFHKCKCSVVSKLRAAGARVPGSSQNRYRVEKAPYVMKAAIILCRDIF